jgi:DNA-binding response OmpR family regulator
MAAQEKRLVLIVEDDPIYAEFLRTSISRTGLPLNLLHLATLDQALAYVRGDPPYNDRSAHPMPAIVLLDVVLAQTRGFPVLAFLRDHGHLDDEKTRVIMLAASDRTEDVQEALQLGAISYLVKSPFASTVTNLVRRFCDG